MIYVSNKKDISRERLFSYSCSSPMCPFHIYRRISYKDLGEYYENDGWHGQLVVTVDLLKEYKIF
jgi:hypothetical protein